jgi:hypothetical protein
MSDCVENGFVKNATQPDAAAALRIAGSSLPAHPRTMQRRVPSLPTMPWQDDGR